MLPELYEKYKHLEDLKVFWGGKSKKDYKRNGIS